MKVTLKGTGALIDKMGSPLYAMPVSRFFRKSGFAIMGNIIDIAPNFDGGLHNSIVVDEDHSMPPRFVRVETDKEYAPSVEFGRKPGKRPPVAAIAPWAKSHGIPPMALAISIGKKGTKAHPFMAPGLENTKGDIQAFLNQLARDIESSNAV